MWARTGRWHQHGEDNETDDGQRDPNGSPPHCGIPSQVTASNKAGQPVRDAHHTPVSG
jgi:hypothetical protein